MATNLPSLPFRGENQRQPVDPRVATVDNTLKPSIVLGVPTMPHHCPHCQQPIDFVEIAGKDEKAPSRSLGRIERSWRWVQRNPVLTGVLAALLAIIATSQVLVTWQWLAAERQRALAKQLEAEAAQQRDVAADACMLEHSLRQEAEAERQKTRAALRLALLRQAEALRQSTQTGRRGLALDALKQAADIQPGPDVRNAYLRSLDIAEGPQAQPLGRMISLLSTSQAVAPVSLLTFSPTDRWLACAVQGGPPKLVDLESPDEIHTFPGPAGQNTLAFAPDGTQIWRVNDQNHSVWQLSPALKGKESVGDPTLHAVKAAYNSKGQRLAAGTASLMELKVLDLTTGQEAWTHREQAVFPVVEPRFSPGGRRLVAPVNARGQGRIKVWDSSTGKLAYERPEAKPLAIFFHGQTPAVLAEGESGNRTVRDLQANSLLDPLPTDAPAGGTRYHFSEDGLLCAETREGGTIALWDFPQRAVRLTIKRKRASPERDPQVFSPSGTRFVAIDEDSLKVWDTKEGKELGQLRMQLLGVIFAEKEEELWLVDRDGAVWSWRVNEKEAKPLGKLQPEKKQQAEPKMPFTSAGTFHISRDRKRAIYLPAETNEQGVIRVHVWELPAGVPVAQYPVAFKAKLRPRVAVSADGTKLALLTQQETARVWSLDSGGGVLDLGKTAVAKVLPTLQFSPDGDAVAWLEDRDTQKVLKVFDLETRSDLLAETLPPVPGMCLALAERGTLVAVGGDRDITVYETKTKKKTATLTGHEGTITALAFARAGNVLASVSANDGTVRLWNPMSGETLATFPTSQKNVQTVALSPSGRWLATGGDGLIRLWDLAEARRQLKQVGLDWSAPSIVLPPKPPAGSALAFLEVAHRHHFSGRFHEAVDAYSQALALDGKQAQVYEDRGEALFQLGKYSEAAADFEKAKELAPGPVYSENFIAALQYRGVALAESGKWDQAVSDFRKAIYVGAEKQNTRHEMALLRLASGDLRGYQRACASLLEHLNEKDKPPTTNPVIRTCTLAPGASDNYARLIALAEDAVDGDPRNWTYNHTLGAVHYRAAEFDTAIQRLNQAIKVEGKEGYIRDWLFLAMAYQQLGHPEDAKRWLDKAVRGIQQVTGDKTRQADRGKPLPWSQRLELLLLRREAEVLIKGARK
jgi:WD40 repeat protein/Tfp pilus assembly protein PilF